MGHKLGCMNLNEYTTAATATAEPRAYDTEYLLPGLLGEVGELFSEFAKQHWHESDRHATIVDEYGDICWLTAVLLHTCKMDEAAVAAMAGKYHEEAHQNLDGALDLILARTVAVYHSYLPQMGMRAAMLWHALQQHSLVVTGQEFATVLQRNIDKLAERSGKGELKTHA